MQPHVSQELLLKYKNHRKEDFQNCLEFLSNQNFVGIEKIGHKLKGNGMTFGFPELSVLGADLEKYAIKREALSLEKTLKEFSSWIGTKH